MKTALLVLALVACAGVALAACPNHCSGRGTCGEDDKCACYSRYQGPDCSERKCKENIAWVDGTVAAPHAYAECSNKGICDRETGECVCNPLFDGAACQRMICPNACSGHGTCEYINDLAGSYAASNWDATKIQGCKCDGGWEGYDCSLRMCPRGDDPLTIHDATTNPGDIHTLSTVSGTSGTPLDGEAVFLVQDLYGSWETSRPFSVDSATEAEAALEDLDIINSISSVTVNSYTAVDSNDGNGFTYVITLSDPPHVTQIAIEGKSCNDAGCYGKRDAGSAEPSVNTAVIASIVTTDMTTQEAAVCSNRGLCDRATGICQCFEGHTGLACETQTILV